MTVEEFNALVEQAYAAAFDFENRLKVVYEIEYLHQANLAAQRFERQTTPVTAAAWTPPVVQSLTDGMSEKSERDANAVRDEAAAAILAVFASLGIAAFGQEFLEAISLRAQANFEQELLRNLRKIVSDSFDAGLSSEETGLAIRDKFAHVTPASAEMLAQTELTALVNERSVVAAQKAFPDGVSKTWLTVGDNRVRAAHAHAQGQTVPVDQPFSVGGASLMYPGDPMGPLRLVARCRCRLSYTNDPAAVVASAQEDNLMSMTELTFDGDGNAIAYADTAVNSFSTITITTDTTTDSNALPEAAMEDGPAWKALLAVEGVVSEDGRMLAEGSLTWRDLPLTLTAMDTSQHGAEGEAKVAGRIDQIWRDGSEVWGSGVFNGDEYGLYIASLVSNQSLRGNSIEPAVLDYEYRYRDTMELVPDSEALMEAMMEDRPLVTVFLDAIIMASTVVATPALADASIVLASGVMRTVWFEEQPTVVDVLTAGAAGMAPLHPPAAWFDNPNLDGPTPLTITPEGRVLGHVGLWNTCHIGEPSGPGVCVTPPRSGMNYEVFHHGALQTAEGHDVVVGQLTLGTLHAGSDLGWKATMEHYEHSGLAFADVHAYEDRHGIVIAGALRPDVPAEKVREAKAGTLSGDWRQVIGRGLEFLAALVVNVPGFPIPRPEARIVASAAGEEEVLTLVAAGMVPAADEVEGMSRREYLRKIHALTV